MIQKIQDEIMIAHNIPPETSCFFQPHFLEGNSKTDEVVCLLPPLALKRVWVIPLLSLTHTLEPILSDVAHFD